VAAIDHLRQSRSAVLGLALALLAMGGCGTGQWMYSKADASEPDRERDETECRQNAMVPRVLRPIVLEGSKVVSYPLMSIDLKVYNQCMEAKGYVVTGN
jgi:hypothetical protein